MKLEKNGSLVEFWEENNGGHTVRMAYRNDTATDPLVLTMKGVYYNRIFALPVVLFSVHSKD